MQYSDKHQLYKTICNFLKQRRRVYRVISKDPRRQMLAESILNDFDMLKGHGYWALCRKVKALESKFMLLLPSANGKHHSVRESILQLISHCKQIAEKPKHNKDFIAGGLPRG